LNRISKVLISFIILGLPAGLKAQVDTKIYMSLTAGYGMLNGTSTYNTNFFSSITSENERITNIPLALNFHFNSIGKKRINFGAYGSFMAGAGNSKSKITSQPDGKTSYYESLDPAIAVKLGPQINYIFKDTSFLIGIRYFNWYMDEGLRAPNSIEDDGAAIGIYLANKIFGLDINYAPKNLPGVLVYNDCDLLQIEFRYKARKNFTNTKISRIFGIRYEYSNYNVSSDTTTPFWYPINKKAKTQFIAIMYGFSFNR
jgi:hypothetical protein